MAVRYSPLPELEVPNLNLMGAYAQGQIMQQNALQQQRLQQQMELANLASGYTASKEMREAEKFEAERKVKDFELASKKYDYLVNMAPRLNERNYDAWYKQVAETFPLAAATLPPQYDPEAVKAIALQGADLKPQIMQQTFGDTSRFVRVGPTGAAQVVPGTEVSAAPQYEVVKGAGDTILGYKSKYGTEMLSPEEFEQRQYTLGREGTGKNPRSSAEGPGQFIDSTFVSTFRKTFPDQAQGMSREQILAQRGTGVEDRMLSTLTQENMGALKSAGFQPSKGNTYLAHFLGAPNAIDVLEASPDTPVSEILSPKVLKANPEVFAKAKTAGDLIKWAGGGAPEQGGAMQPAKMKPIGTPARAAQDASLNIIADLGFDESGEDRVSKLINASSSGAADVALSQVPRIFGVATPGREAIAQLEVLSNEYSLDKLGGKLGGNVSNADVQFISKTMGDIANPLIPAAERLRAWNEVKRRLARYADVKLPMAKVAEAETKPRGVAGETEKPAERKRIKRRGTYNGRPVVEYDDGTVDYAN